MFSKHPRTIQNHYRKMALGNLLSLFSRYKLMCQLRQANFKWCVTLVINEMVIEIKVTLDSVFSRMAHFGNFSASK